MADDILKTLIAEAYGEGPEGMRLVAETILNRAAIRGLTPEEVVRQPKQYTGLKSPGPAAKRAWDNPNALAAAQAAWQLAQEPGDPTDGADHYYAQGTISQPWWAKGMTPKGEIGGHTFYSSRPVPPGELPQVATALSTVGTPSAPVPATPSIDMAQMRRISAPSQLVADSMARVKRPARNLGDDIGMSPIPGGKQNAPLFDAGYDTRTGSMRLFSNGPADTQGVFTAASRPPAPVPATPSTQMAARRANDPTLQAALNARYPAQLPPLPPSTRMVATSTIRPSASDLVRGNPMQTRERATLVASIPTRPQVSASDLARGRSGISTIASIPTTGFPTTEQITAATGFRGGGIPPVPDRLMASSPYPPALYGGLNMGVGGPPVAPVPFMRPPGLGGAPRIAPVPFMRPTQRPIVPMPPMPITRPGTGGPFRIAPMPMPANMRPASRPTASRPPLRITVNGGSGSGSGSGSRPTPQGYTDTGNGRLVSDETGGVYFSRHL